METATREGDWISAVAARLSQQWPSIDPQSLKGLASNLWGYQNLRAMEPNRAADAWLAPGEP
jgi:hypothetical protein